MGEEGEKDEDNTSNTAKEQTAELFCGSCMQSILPAHSKACKRKYFLRLERLRNTGFCHNCIQCSKCEKTKCRTDFPSTSDVLKRSEPIRVCIDCLHPECTNPSCKTCKVCRDTSCKKKQCNKKPRALLGRAAQYIRFLKQYECDACFFPKCACGKEMSATTRYEKRRSPEWLSAMTPRTWSCKCCQKTNAAELKRKSSAEKESIIRAVRWRLTRKTCQKTDAAKLKRKSSAEKESMKRDNETIKSKRRQEDRMMMLDSMYARSVLVHPCLGQLG